MSRGDNTRFDSSHRPGGGKPERYILPSLLLGLLQRPSYGYELIQQLPEFGFVADPAPPGMIYRHLRQLEEDGLVTSRWETGDSGPAKRVYALTAEGHEALALWVVYMERRVARLTGFIDRYRRLCDPPGVRPG